MCVNLCHCLRLKLFTSALLSFQMDIIRNWNTAVECSLPKEIIVATLQLHFETSITTTHNDRRYLIRNTVRCILDNIMCNFDFITTYIEIYLGILLGLVKLCPIIFCKFQECYNNYTMGYKKITIIFSV